MLEIDKCRNCYHYMSFKGLPSLFDAANTGMCMEAGENYKQWVVMAITDTCCNFKDKAGAAVLAKAKYTKPGSEESGCFNCAAWERIEESAQGNCKAYKKITQDSHYCEVYKSKQRATGCKECINWEGVGGSMFGWCPIHKRQVDGVAKCAQFQLALDILKSTEPVGKCEDCTNWNAPDGVTTAFCPEAQNHVLSTACCRKYVESPVKRIIQPKPIPIVETPKCARCISCQGDKTQKVAWCTKKMEAVDTQSCCNDYKKAAELPPLPQSTPIQPKDEIGPGERFEAVVGQTMILVWVGEQLVIGKDDSGKEHGFDKKTMRFRKC